MRAYEWITFDCYGTLIDWETGITNAFERVAKMTDSPFDRQKILELYAKYESAEEFSYKKYREVLNRVARRICVELGYRTEDFTFLSESLSRWRPFPETNAALERLASKFKLGILSNVDNDLLAETRRHFTVNFELIITAEQVGSYKPEPRHFLEAKKKIGQVKWLHAAQSYYHDIIPCNRNSIEAAWINRKQEPLHDPKVVPLCQVSNLIAFVNWIEEVE